MDCKKCKIIGHLDLSKTYLVQIGDKDNMPTIYDIDLANARLSDTGLKVVCIGPLVKFIEPKEMKGKKDGR